MTTTNKKTREEALDGFRSGNPSTSDFEALGMPFEYFLRFSQANERSRASACRFILQSAIPIVGVDREEFAAYVNANVDELTDNPIETEGMSALQYLSREFPTIVMAQAIYNRAIPRGEPVPIIPRYEVRQRLTE